MVRIFIRGKKSPVLIRISSQIDLPANIDRIKPAKRPVKARRRIFMLSRFHVLLGTWILEKLQGNDYPGAIGGPYILVALHRYPFSLFNDPVGILGVTDDAHRTDVKTEQTAGFLAVGSGQVAAESHLHGLFPIVSRNKKLT